MNSCVSCDTKIDEAATWEGGYCYECWADVEITRLKTEYQRLQTAFEQQEVEITALKAELTKLTCQRDLNCWNSGHPTMCGKVQDATNRADAAMAKITRIAVLTEVWSDQCDHCRWAAATIQQALGEN